MQPSTGTALRDKLHKFIGYSELQHLAHNLADVQREKMYRSIAILSVFPAEGKTLVCAALAMAYAEISRARVLIVDTTTVRNNNSLTLKECFNGSTPTIDVLSIEELRKGIGSFAAPAVAAPRPEKTSILESQVVFEKTIPVSMAKETDFSMLKRITEEQSKQYALVLLDTAALQVRNRSNLDPSLVARICHASVLVASRRLLNAPNIQSTLNFLKDPNLHLAGIIANEDFSK